jgi:polar amino acid transport system substrate-binding protein
MPKVGALNTMNTMKWCVTLLALTMVGVGSVHAQGKPSSEVVRDLAPTGRLRAAINFGNGVLVQKAADGTAGGVSPDLAIALAKRLGVPVEFVMFPSAGQTFAAASTGAWDIAFLAIDPVRAAEADFSPPYVIIHGAYLVRAASAFRELSDVDKPGVTIGVGQGSIYDLYLTRTLQNAKLVRNPKGGATGGIEPFLEQKLDVAAGVRDPLEAYAKTHPDTRLLPGSFQEIRQAVATPKGRSAASIAYLRAFVEAMKANGFVADALVRSNQTASVAPPAN